MPGLAIAMLKVGAWANLLFGVGLALAISFSGFAPPLPPGPLVDFARIALELISAFEGFMGWALLLVVATIAEQLEQVHAALTKET
jgi:hypothetical protein